MTPPTPDTSPTALARLRERIRELLPKVTPGPWELWTSCSWRRFGSRDGKHVCEPIVHHRDNCPDLHFNNGGPDGPDAALIALAPTMAGAILALESENGRLRNVIEEAFGCFEAATGEGWHDALANEDMDRINDLWRRRIAHAQDYLLAAVNGGSVIGSREQSEKRATAAEARLLEIADAMDKAISEQRTLGAYYKVGVVSALHHIAAIARSKPAAVTK